MSIIQVQDKELLSAVTALIEAIHEQPIDLHPNSPMTAEDIHEYLNKRFAVNKIAKAMRTGEIENCVHLGNKMITLKKHVDKWIENIFAMQDPATVAGYEIVPIKHKNALLRRVI